MTNIRNPWAGFPIIFTWDQHREDGYAGGTDYGAPAGSPVVAPAAGVARRVNDGLNTIAIRIAGGVDINMRENGATHGTFPRTVKQGERIATTGLVRSGIRRAPHIDATVRNTRVPFESLLTTPAGGTSMATVAEIVAGVWARTVNRSGTKVTAIQELADAKTAALQAVANTQRILEIVSKPTPPPALTPAQLSALAADVASRIKPRSSGTFTLND